MTRTEARKKGLLRRRGLSPSERRDLGLRIARRVRQLPEWEEARSLGCYISLPDEVPTCDLIQSAFNADKIVAVPITRLKPPGLIFGRLADLAHLRPGPMGIPEPEARHPLSLDQLDILIVPGVSFDTAGNRLGYGQGFFDRCLAQYHGPTIGLAFEVQLQSGWECRAHDVPLRCLVTEKRVIRCQTPAAKNCSSPETA